MFTDRKKTPIAWLSLALLLGVQTWIVHHKAQDHHHWVEPGQAHQHGLVEPQAWMLLWLNPAGSLPVEDHSHDDHPDHPDRDHEITWAPQRKADAPVPDSPLWLIPTACIPLLVTSEPDPVAFTHQKAPRTRAHASWQPRGPPLFVVA